MNEMQVFQNSEFGELGVLEVDGKPYFPATACAKKLGYSNPRDAIKRHCKEEGVVKHDGVSFTTNQHGVRSEQIVQSNFITEGNLYRLIIHSKLPAAEKFERWVFDEVLPAIRKRGGYGSIDMTAIIMQTATTVCTEMVKQLAPMLQSLVRVPMVEEGILLESEPEAADQRLRFRKRPSSIIDKLCPDLRKEVEEMLCDGRYTYADIANRLKRDGVHISPASICRYAKRNGCYATYEVRGK